MTCTTCNGLGLVDKTEGDEVYAQEVCPGCKGTGFVGEPPTVKIKKIRK